MLTRLRQCICLVIFFTCQYCSYAKSLYSSLPSLKLVFGFSLPRECPWTMQAVCSSKHAWMIKVPKAIGRHSFPQCYPRFREKFFYFQLKIISPTYVCVLMYPLILLQVFPLYFFSNFFRARFELFPRPHYLSLGLKGCSIFWAYWPPTDCKSCTSLQDARDLQDWPAESTC